MTDKFSEPLKLDGDGKLNVLVIDSGISMHPNMSDITILPTGFNYQNSLDDVVDFIGHGTAVTSLIVKDIEELTIYVLKLFNELFECTISKLIDALSYIEKNNIYDVINMSLGITMFEERSQFIMTP